MIAVVKVFDKLDVWFYGPGMTKSDNAQSAKASTGYTCQFCGKTASVKMWKRGGDECPNCVHLYDAMLAQETETE